jgi:PhnB protein
MSRVNVYLNFPGTTEEAFEFYRSVFGGEFAGFQRMSEVPGMELPPEAGNLIMHVALPLFGDTLLMGTDVVESMGHTLRTGDNISISLEPDSLEQTQAIFASLSDGGSEIVPLEKMFWGAYYSSFIDRFGIRWMLNFAD